MKKGFFLAVAFSAVLVYGQTAPIDQYLTGAEADLTNALSTRAVRDIAGLLPDSRVNSFIRYYYVHSPQNYASTLALVEALRLNKMVGASPGAPGTTSLASQATAPAVIGVGVEYGGIVQQTNGAVATLRANLLGLTRLAVGQEQFPYCPEIDQKNCKRSTRRMRRFSSSLSIQQASSASSTATVLLAGSTEPAVVQLFGNGVRMASWGLRFDLTASNNLDDPKYVRVWRSAVANLRQDTAATRFTTAVGDLFQKYTQSRPDGSDGIYMEWRANTIMALQGAATEAEFKQVLAEQLNALIQHLSQADPLFPAAMAAVDRAFNEHAGVRDNLIREAQRHKLALEYTNQHLPNQPFYSNMRLVYSHQPTNSPTHITLNAGFSWYHQIPAGTGISRFRDFQIAGQLDRRLGMVPNFGYAVLTLGGYFQYMQDDSVVIIGPGNVVPNSGIVLPGTAATLVGTNGTIGVAQAKVSIPIGSTLKVPLSLTWSNRTELTNEKDIRAQIGMILDFDALFH